jgi:hypothetical protein
MAAGMNTIRFKETDDHEAFTLVRFSDMHRDLYSPEVLESAGEAAHRVMIGAWIAKLVPKALTEAEVASKIPTPDEFSSRLERPPKNTEYWLAYDQQQRWPDEAVMSGAIKGLLKIEAYKPRRPFALAYPNITDLEVPSGSIFPENEHIAAALIHESVRIMSWRLGVPPLRKIPDREGNRIRERKLSAYEIAGSDGIAFYEKLGMRQTGNQPTETVGAGEVTYVHLEAKSEGTVRNIAVRSYPWLRWY